VKDLPVLIIFLLAIAFLLRVDFVFYIAYVCIGLYAWSIWYTPRALKRLRSSRQFSGHAFLGERVPVTLRLANDGRLPLPWIRLNESVPLRLRGGEPPGRVLSLRGRESYTFVYHVLAARRGYYRLGPLSIGAGDQFGFGENSASLPADYLTVYPRIIPLSRLGLPSRLPFGTVQSRQRLFEDPARPAGVRDYRSGDSLRHINWKVSAHTESLAVRTFQPAISLETALLVNLDQRDYERRERLTGPEWAIEVAASLAAHLVEGRQPVGLATNGADPLRPSGAEAGEALLFDEESGRLLMRRSNGGERLAAVPAPIPPRPGRAHLMKVLELLARVEAGETVAFNAWAPGACAHLSWGVTLLAITPRGDEPTCRVLHSLLRAGYNPVLVVVQPVASFGQVQERARRLGFRAYYVPERRDLKVWQQPHFRGGAV
jgi:uncharacterized protein (DUF58 family)